MHRTDKNSDYKGKLKMRRSRKAKRRIAASILTGMFILQQGISLSTPAAITLDSTFGNNGTNTNYADGLIKPGHIDGATGFQKYTEFNLGAGETANLDFSNIDTFVNLLTVLIRLMVL